MKTSMLRLLSFLSLSLCSLAADSTVVAKVGNSEVRADDLKPYLEKLSVKDQLLLSKNPAALNEYVRSLIVQQLVYKEAQAKKWDQQPQVVAALDKIRQQAVTQSYLQSVASPGQDFPSATDLQAAYDQLKKANALQVPKQYHLSQIYIACPKGSDKSVEEKAQNKLDAAVKALKSGDFTAIAKAQSDDSVSAQRGGDLGFLSESQIQPEIRSAIVSLAKNGTTDPIRLNDGWHIIRLTEVKDPYTASLDEVKGALTNELRNKKAQVLGKAYLAKLLQENPVTLNEIAVSKLIDQKGN
jgi:parvulin-like peptidyl-prolyl isomerase